MIIHGIIICVSGSKNLPTISNRVKPLISNLHIQEEIKHPTNPTIGCYMAHMKALLYGIELMQRKNLEYIIIGEEDIVIDYNSKYYNNIIECLKNYSRFSQYILHLGGIPNVTNSIKNITKNIINKNILITDVYLTTCYAINISIAKKLYSILNKSSYHIHCDAIFANSRIEQRLVKGNIVNQLNDYSSKNTYLHNFLDTKSVIDVNLYFNKFSIFFVTDFTIIALLVTINIYNGFLLKSLTIETLIYTINIIKPYLLNYRFNKYLNKNIFTYLEIVKLLRIITFKEIINIVL